MNVLHENRPVQRISRGGRRLEHDAMADESLVSIVQGGRTLTRLLASRNDLKALTIGHMALEHGCTLDENSLSVNPQSDGSVHIVIDDGIEIPATVARPDIVTSSCGACHHPSLTERVTTPSTASQTPSHASVDLVAHAFEMMERQQPGFEATGGLHAAMLWASDETYLVKEDIGRHNAVDKAWGAWKQTHPHRQPTMLLLSGRLGWDITAKAVHIGVSTIACRVAASTLSVDTARTNGLRLVTFWKSTGFVVIGPLQGSVDAKD